MADLGKSLKNAWMKGMEAIGNTASNIASSTRSKVDEMNVVNRRRDILADFGAQAYELWQKGEQFPEALQALLEELSSLDEQLNAIRTERLAGVETKETVATDEAPETEEAEEASAEAVETVAEEAENLSDEEIVQEVAAALEEAAEAEPSTEA